jgi:hypothetical protein
VRHLSLAGRLFILLIFRKRESFPKYLMQIHRSVEICICHVSTIKTPKGGFVREPLAKSTAFIADLPACAEGRQAM